jgi:hypothetical protein
MRGAKRKTLGLAACSFTNKHGARPRVSLKTVARRKAANFAAGVDVDKPDPAVPSREDENGGSTQPVSNRSSGRSSGSGPSPDHLPSPERGPVVYRSGSTTSITAARPRRNGSDCSVTGFPFAAVCMKTTAGNTAARVMASIAMGESESIGLDAHYLVLRFLRTSDGNAGRPAQQRQRREAYALALNGKISKEQARLWAKGTAVPSATPPASRHVRAAVLPVRAGGGVVGGISGDGPLEGVVEGWSEDRKVPNSASCGSPTESR